MKRRELIAGLSATTLALPLAALAQQQRQMRVIGVLNPFAREDSEFRARLTAFEQELRKKGWIEGRNVRLERRLPMLDLSDIRAHAAELVALGPDVIVTTSNLVTNIVSQQTQTIPIVFTAGDAVGTGLVSSMGRPSGNMTGFTSYEVAIGGKWLQLLKEIAPRMTRVAVVYTPGGAGSEGLMHTVEVTAPSLGVRATAIPARGPQQIEREIDAFSAESGNAGLMSLTGPNVVLYREHILAAATRHGLPAIYFGRHYVTAGGLMSYAADNSDIYRRAASYVDRILRGEKPGDLPIQLPTKFELVINGKTAKALGLEIPGTLFAIADEVIE